MHNTGSRRVENKRKRVARKAVNSASGLSDPRPLLGEYSTVNHNSSKCTLISIPRSPFDVDVELTLNFLPYFVSTTLDTMAGDTRDSNSPPQPRGPPPGETSPPEHVRTPNKVYEVFSGPPPNANALPEGSGQNTAGKQEVPTLKDAIKTLHIQDFKQVYMYPCVRESLLAGIGGGFGMGGIRALWGGMNCNHSLSVIVF